MGGIISSLLPADLFYQTLSFGRKQANYLLRVESNLRELKTELESLDALRKDLWDEVVLAKQQQPGVGETRQVKEWDQMVEQMKTKVEELENEGQQEGDRMCLGGFCPDLWFRYLFGRKVVNLKVQVTSVTGDREKIQNIVQRLPEGAAVPKPVQQIIVGQELLLGQVWRCITDQEKNKGIIGLYGQGGVGKSTLLKQVNNKFCIEEHGFDVVIWSVVSKEPNLKQIQENIGDRIGFRNESWKKKSFEAKAIDITNTLRHKKFVLLLDDIWETIIDLTELGVPLQNLQFGSKIVFTTRFRGKCGEMGADKRFEVSCLADDDAWKLFRGLVGRYALDKHPEIQELAKAVASKCHRLPLALTTVGKAMASKEYPEEWRQAIDIISTSASKIKDIEEKVLPCLKFIYDSLRNDELRSCLLYCCLFPEDSEILKTDLIEYWKSEGFLDSITDWDVLLLIVHPYWRKKVIT
ncbi:hypothetical protein CUMW_198920 [Citrus unshiu]|nr:hypothetical protein CUMW_198920 [Citrus unshiu]